MKNIKEKLDAFKEGWFSCGSLFGILFSLILLSMSAILLYYGFKTGFIEVLIAGFASFAFYSLLLFVEIKSFLRKIKKEKK